jgi:hypothetical protein
MRLAEKLYWKGLVMYIYNAIKIKCLIIITYLVVLHVTLRTRTNKICPISWLYFRNYSFD